MPTTASEDSKTTTTKATEKNTKQPIKKVEVQLAPIPLNREKTEELPVIGTLNWFDALEQGISFRKLDLLKNQFPTSEMMQSDIHEVYGYYSIYGSEVGCYKIIFDELYPLAFIADIFQELDIETSSPTKVKAFIAKLTNYKSQIKEKKAESILKGLDLSPEQLASLAEKLKKG